MGLGGANHAVLLLYKQLLLKPFQNPAQYKLIAQLNWFVSTSKENWAACPMQVNQVILYLHNAPTCKETLLYCMRGFGFSCVLYMFAWVPCLVFNVYAVKPVFWSGRLYTVWCIYNIYVHITCCIMYMSYCIVCAAYICRRGRGLLTTNRLGTHHNQSGGKMRPLQLQHHQHHHKHLWGGDELPVWEMWTRKTFVEHFYFRRGASIGEW